MPLRRPQMVFSQSEVLIFYTLRRTRKITNHVIQRSIRRAPVWLESLAEWMGFPAYYAMYGEKEPPRSGASHSSIAPYGPFACADGEVVFLGIPNQGEWEKFCEVVLGRPEMTGDERFQNNSRRVENREVLEEEISTVFRDLSSEEAIDKFERGGIANARLRSVRDFLGHPQLQARDRWREVGSPAGPLHALLPPATMSGVDPVMDPIPEVGEQTGKILLELGYDEASVAELHREEAVGG